MSPKTFSYCDVCERSVDYRDGRYISGFTAKGETSINVHRLSSCGHETHFEVLEGHHAK